MKLRTSHPSPSALNLGRIAQLTESIVSHTKPKDEEPVKSVVDFGAGESDVEFAASGGGVSAAAVRCGRGMDARPTEPGEHHRHRPARRGAASLCREVGGN